MTNLQKVKVTEKNLEIISMTKGRNGYPSGTYSAIDASKCENFEEVQRIAKENDLEIIHAHKRDGWDFWEYQGQAFDPIDVRAHFETEKDNYQCLKKMSEEDFIENEVAPVLEDKSTFKEIEEILQSKKAIWDDVKNLEPTQFAVIDDGQYFDTFEEKALSLSDDTHNWIIALREED